MAINRRHLLWTAVAVAFSEGIAKSVPSAQTNGGLEASTPAIPTITLPSNISYISRDASGKIVASQNPDRIGAIASQAKVVMLYSAMNQIGQKFGRREALQFAVDYQKDIKEFMSYSNPDDYNRAAIRIGRAAAKKLGFSESEFLAKINADIKTITVASDHVSSTYISNYTGNGQTTMRDISAIMFEAATQFPGVFTHRYGNNFNPNWTNTNQTFMKPGDLGERELASAGVSETMSNSLAVTAYGGIVAVAVVGGKDQSRYADIKQGTLVAISFLVPASTLAAASPPKKNLLKRWWLLSFGAN